MKATQALKKLATTTSTKKDRKKELKHLKRQLEELKKTAVLNDETETDSHIAVPDNEAEPEILEEDQGFIPMEPAQEDQDDHDDHEEVTDGQVDQEQAEVRPSFVPRVKPVAKVPRQGPTPRDKSRLSRLSPSATTRILQGDHPAIAVKDMMPSMPLLIMTPIQTKLKSMEILLSRCSKLVAHRDPLRQQAFSKPFSGSNENFDDFLERFEQRATLAQWTESDRIALLGTCLSGPALKLYNRLLEKGDIVDMELADLENYLRKSFPTATVDQATALLMLTQLAQGQDERIPEYAIRFEQAAKRADMFGHKALLKTWCNSVSMELRQALGVYRMTPEGRAATFEQLVDYTVGLEDNMSTHVGRDTSRKRKQRHDQLPTDDDEDEESDDGPAVGRGGPKLRKITAETPSQFNSDQLLDMMLNRILGLQGTNPPENSVAQQNSGTISDKIRQLQAGSGSMPTQQTPQHVMSQLPPSQVVQPQVVNQTQRPRGETRSCYTCGEQGHLKWQCPQRVNQGGSTRDRNDGTQAPSNAWHGGRDQGSQGPRNRDEGRGRRDRGGDGQGRGHGRDQGNAQQRDQQAVRSGANAVPVPAPPPLMITQDTFNKLFQNAITSVPGMAIRALDASETHSVSTKPQASRQGN